MTCRRPGRHRALLLAGLLALALPAGGQRAAGAATPRARDRALARRLDAILADPQFQQGFYGVYVFSLDRNRVVYNHDGDHLFTPASNAKLFTLAAALSLLGPDFHFHTVVQSAAAPGPDGTVAGDVVLVGAGDPSLSGRPYPYRPDPPEPAVPYDPMLVPRALAAQLKSRGVTRVAGDVVGDDSYYAADPFPDGWDIGDELWDYGAPVSALTLDDNTRWLQVFPGAAAGAAPRLVWSPAAGAPALRDQAATTPARAAARLRLGRDPLSGELVLAGSIAAGSPGVLEALAVADPALYAARLLRQALLEAGIAVDGEARARHRAAPAGGAPPFTLAARDSPPLAEILQATAKVSQNLEAELALRALGKLRGAPGGGATEAERGAAVVRAFLQGAGLGARDTDLYDGSGLSRQDLVTPAGVVRLLRYMDGRAGPAAARWRALLPVAGRDGTLEHRFLGSPAAGRLEAKTGSLNHVNALSGYVTTRGGGRIAFALISNNAGRPAAAVRAHLDRLAAAIAAW